MEEKETIIERKEDEEKPIKECIYFPHDEIRAEQLKLINDINTALETKTPLLAHAPTGLGKTAAALAPCLEHAIKNDLTIFFLTSRHTQHIIAIDTLNKIKKKHGLDFAIADIIGKKWMCAMPAVTTLASSDFVEFCKSVREHDKCEFYMNTRAKNSLSLSVLAKKIVQEVKHTSCDVGEIKQIALLNRLCPYEISLEIAKKAKVIIADYYYIFNQKISDKFLKKIGKELKDVIVIVDEAHNLPKRVSELASSKLSSFIIKAAIQEAKKHNYQETIFNLTIVQNALLTLAKEMKEGNERIVTRKAFFEIINKEKDYDELIAELTFIADNVREEQKRSFIGSVASFLEQWITQDMMECSGGKCSEGKDASNNPDAAFARILSVVQSRKSLQQETVLTLNYRCLDPSVMTANIIENTYTTIFMSGTLSPTAMYRDLLGIKSDRSIEKMYESPFPNKNRLNLIIPKTTTKFSLRNDEQYQKMAEICSVIVESVQGNSLLFFPSYAIRDNVSRFFSTQTKKTIFTEHPNMLNEEKKEMLERFKSYKDSGAVLLAATSGSFGEGIDLPGDLLKCVVIVGLPLQQPNLETKELIKYFDNKYSKGWEYGYIFPAFQKTLQNAGRCIRTETDKGVIVFLDERYIWPMYYKCFPEDWDIEVKKEPKEIIEKFFKENCG